MQRAILATYGMGELPGLAAVVQRYGLTSFELAPAKLYVGSGLPVSGGIDDLIIGDSFDHPDQSGTRWGNYLRFRGVGAAGMSVERAALTGMPLYWKRCGSGILLFSHLELVEPIASGFAIDWDFVRHSLAYRNFRTDRTGIAGVAELLPGMRLKLDGERASVEPFWLPWSHILTNRDWDPQRASMAVEASAIACVDRWSERPENRLLELSGGLDSSIIAASLAACCRPFTGVTVATKTPDGDERRYAREVAAHCGAKLIEAPIAEMDIDLFSAPARLSVRPAAASILAGFDRAIYRVIESEQCDEIWSGIGGDNIFGYSHSVSPAVDAWIAYGLRAPLFRLLKDIAGVAETTIWHAARILIRRIRAPEARALWPRDDIFADRSSLPTTPFEHPWHADASACPPGKRQHVEALMRIADFMDRPDRWHDRKVVAPLLSQPLVETCLGIPSWMWVAGGRDRAVARAAFARRLPPAVRSRRSKGRLETMCSTAFERDRSGLAALLIEGRLMQEGLLDQREIEAYFARADVDAEFAYFRLLEIADLELWVCSTEAAFD